jgi:hypothetical protein
MRVSCSGGAFWREVISAAKAEVDHINVSGFEGLHIGLHVVSAVPPRAPHGAPLAALLIGGPLPHVGPHVVQAVHALARGPGGCGAGPGVWVAGVRALRAVTRAPGISFAFHPRRWGVVTQLGEPRLLPFRACGQAAPCPAAVSLRLGKIQVHSRQISRGRNAIRLRQDQPGRRTHPPTYSKPPPSFSARVTVPVART